MWFPCRKSDLGFCFQKSQTTGSPFFGRSNIDGPRLGWSRCIRCPGDSWHFRGHLPVSSAAFSLSGGLSGDEKIRENDQKILGGGLQILNENPWKSHGICPNSILELQKSRPQKLGTQLAWKATVVGFTNHVPETNPAMAQISGMVQFLIFLHLISLFPLFPLNLPLPCLQYSFPSSCSCCCCLCCRCSCSCGFQPSDGHHFGELSWRVSHPMTLPLAAALVARTPLTPFTPFSVQAKQLQNACKNVSGMEPGIRIHNDGT